MSNRTYSIESAIQEFGKETVTNWLNQFISNRAYRKAYQADRNAAYKAAKSDPRFKAILADVKAKKKVG